MASNDLTTAVRLLESGWPQRFTAEQAAAYLQALDDLPAEAVASAVRNLLRSDEYRPSIARIRRVAVVGALPTEAQALEDARTWLRYRDARQWVNGSGYNPERPQVHSAVVEACAGLRLTGGWQERFLWAWKEQIRRSAGE
jgi:hypothetical protein